MHRALEVRQVDRVGREDGHLEHPVRLQELDQPQVVERQRALHFRFRFGQMDVDAHAQTRRHRRGARQELRRAGVRRMRPQHRLDPAAGRALPLLRERGDLSQVGADLALLAAEHAPGEIGPQPAFHGDLRHPIHVEVVIGKPHRAAADHLGRGQAGAPVDIVSGQRRLDGKNALVEPAVQRQILGIAAEERHRAVRVRVEKTGHDDVTGRVHDLVGLEIRRSLAHGRDRAVRNGHRGVPQNAALGIERQDVSVLQKDVRHKRLRCAIRCYNWSDQLLNQSPRSCPYGSI